MIIHVIDVDLDAPETSTKEHPSQRGVQSFTISGPLAQSTATRLLEEAQLRGFSLDLSRSTLVRGLSWILVEQQGADRVMVQWDDYDRLPRAKIKDGALAVGPFVLPLKAPTGVEPRVERHDDGSREWLSTYVLPGAAAAAIAANVLETLRGLGLLGGGIWPPPAGSPPRWKVEAYDGSRLVQVGIVDSPRGAELEVTYVEGGPPG